MADITTTLLANSFAIISKSSPRFNDHTSASYDITTYTNSDEYMLTEFSNIPDSVRTKKYKYATLELWCESTGSAGNGYLDLHVGHPLKKYNLSELCYADLTDTDLYTTYSKNHYDMNSNTAGYFIAAEEIKPLALAKILDRAAVLRASYVRTYQLRSFSALTSASAHPPRLTIVTEDFDVRLKFSALSPASGYVNRAETAVFAWSLIADADCIYAPAVKSSELRWRVKGDSTWNKISVGATKSYAMAANTLPASSVIEWQVYAIDVNNNAVTSSTAELTTAVPLSTATALAPKGSIEDGAAPIEFKWSYYGSGDVQTAAEIQWSTDKASWTSINVAGSNKSTTVAAGTFATGEIFWRVRTYNSDNAAGTWSSTVSFNVVAPPKAPAVNSTQEPRPTISWQSEEQQAYKVEIDGDSVMFSVIFFGTEQKMTYRGYLPDGQYTVKVSVQNSLGLWSDWGTAPLTVHNSPGSGITLTAVSAGADAALSWTTSGTYDGYIVYRNGTAIAKTTQKSYMDSYSAGSVRYTVRGVSGGNYADSNTVSINIDVDNAAVKLLDGDRWLYLNYSQRASTSHEMAYELEGTYFHFRGAKLPSVELSEFVEDNLKFEFALLNESDVDEFRAMRGKMVCIKIRRGLCYICPLLIVKETSSDFFTVFEVNVRRVHYEEGADIW